MGRKAKRNKGCNYFVRPELCGYKLQWKAPFYPKLQLNNVSRLKTYPSSIWASCSPAGELKIHNVRTLKHTTPIKASSWILIQNAIYKELHLEIMWTSSCASRHENSSHSDTLPQVSWLIFFGATQWENTWCAKLISLPTKHWDRAKCKKIMVLIFK